MRVKQGKMFFAVLVLMASLLSACDRLPALSQLGLNLGIPAYQPVTSDASSVVAMAAPHAPDSPSTLVYCRVSRGAAHFGEKWQDFQIADFALPPDARVNVPLVPVRGNGEVSFQAFFDSAGQKMLFCPLISGPPDRRVSCTSIYALDEDLDAGIKRTFDIPHAIEGGVISCAYSADALRVK
jgi:hypothetical protein